jgi:NAD-dependent dihydropyrimidine dehydrogenase PreA subunit
MAKTTVLISRNTAEDDEKRAVEDALAELLAGSGLPVVVIPHIYHLAEGDGLWRELKDIDGRIVCLSWLYPRPAEWVLRRHGLGESSAEATAPAKAEGDDRALLAFDMGAYACPEECFRAVMEKAPASVPGGDVTKRDGKAAQRWYPVVDRGRCVNCGQCLQFCLFGVYELDDDDSVVARNPDNCKLGCPACSRICPGGAIMFPLCDDAAIAGAPGQLMSPEPGAKAMFYERMKRPCPICGRKYEGESPRGGVPGEAVCAECGLPLESAAASKEADSSAADDLDSLIDDLEQLR